MEFVVKIMGVFAQDKRLSHRKQNTKNELVLVSWSSKACACDCVLDIFREIVMLELIEVDVVEHIVALLASLSHFHLLVLDFT